MKKKNHNSLHSLGKQLELEEFMNNNEQHTFSEEYLNNKAALLESIDKKDKVKRIHNKKFIAAAAAGFVIIAIPGSALAARQIMTDYNISTKQTNNYEYQVAFSGPTDASSTTPENTDVTYVADDTSSSHYDPELYHTFVRMDIGYMMDGYELSSNSSSPDNGLFKYALADDYTESHNITIGLMVINENQVITKNNAIGTKNIVIGDGNDATIFYKNALDVTSYNKDMIIYFKEYGYAVEIFAQVNIDENDLIDIANSITLTQCDESVAMKGSRYNSGTISATSTQSRDYSAKKTLVNENNFFDIGQPFSFDSLSAYNDSSLEYTVEGYKTMDSVAEIDEAGFGFQLDTIKRITDENGKLSYEKQTIEKGDGSNTISKVTDTKTVNARFVYVTMKVKNTSDTDISEIKIEPQICCLGADDTIPYASYYASSKADIDPEGYSLYCDYPTMYDESPDTYDNNRNYYAQRYTIPAGAEIEYHVGFIVDSDRMDNMVLFFNPVGSLTGQSYGYEHTPAIIKLNK